MSDKFMNSAIGFILGIHSRIESSGKGNASWLA